MLLLEDVLKSLPRRSLEASCTPTLSSFDSSPQCTITHDPHPVSQTNSSDVPGSRDVPDSREDAPLLTQQNHYVRSSSSHPNQRNPRPPSPAQDPLVLSPHRSRISSPALSPLPIIERDVRLNRKTTLHTLFRYPLGTVIEYPETSAKGSVGHLFEVAPDEWSNPRLSFAYSQGAPTGRTKAGSYTFCPLLVDDNGEEVPCQEVHATCMYYIMIKLHCAVIL
jgi:hypothetical protein